METQFRKIPIYYVTDMYKWSFYWDGYYISRTIQNIGGNIQTIQNPWDINDSIIHFGDRYNFFSKSDEEIIKFCSSNKVILTWFHGSSDDDNTYKSMISRLTYLHEYLVGIHISSSIYQDIFLKCGFKSSKIHIIPIGVDLSIFFHSKEKRKKIREQLGISDNTICIGSFQKDGIGWDEGSEPKLIKGPDIFVEVVNKIKKEYPNLVILLTGPARGYIKNHLQERKIQHIHHYLDDYHAISNYYAALDLYIITSRIEGGPKALIESWACGVPIVSTKVGMAFDLVENGKNGFLTEIDNVEELSHICLNIIKNPILKERLIVNGQSEVQNYSWEIIGKRYWKEIYLPLIINWTV